MKKKAAVTKEFTQVAQVAQVDNIDTEILTKLVNEEPHASMTFKRDAQNKIVLVAASTPAPAQLKV